MGFLTQHLIAESATFKAKITMALETALDTIINDENAKATHKEAAEKLLNSGLDHFVRDFSRTLAAKGLDLDSTDVEIDTAIVANVKRLLIKAGVRERQQAQP